MSAPESLRIALFTYSTQPRGGVLHALALGDALADLGHHSVVFALDDTGHGFIRAPRCGSVVIPVAPKPATLFAFVTQRIAEYVGAWDSRMAGFDVYHAHDGISGNALATLVERTDIAGFTRTVHHLDRFDTPEMNMLQDRAIAAADRCFAVSEVWRERLSAGYGITAEVVPNGVDTERFTPLGRGERQPRHGRLDVGDGPLFVTIGGIEARKNTLATLEAFALVHARRPDARLAIAGGASVLDHAAYRRRFDARAAELGLREGVEIVLLGVLADEQIVELLRAADALVFPSLNEGFGLVLLEALACATPVVTSAIAPFTEFLTPLDAALVDPNDPPAIARAMLAALDPDVRATVRVRGPELARRHSWRASARAHVAAYRDAARVVRHA